MLQRWSIALAAYNYDIQHRPGKTISQADYLSRYSRFSEAEQCHFISPASPVSRKSLRKSTKQYYSEILSAIKKGWSPEVKRKYPQIFAHREELSVRSDGVLCRADRLVIPPPLRETVLEELHKGHMGVEKMKPLARQMCWWPELDADIYVTDNNSMVEITDLNDATVHKRHVDPIHIKPSRDQWHQERTEGNNQLHTPSVQPTEPHRSDAQTTNQNARTPPGKGGAIDCSPQV
ncbi:unnamed protein product [Echinostoma caproni]|uniref:Integrase_H2C2 domain-containing protein n=1 Tax=Echinostoma caproni TaxID=27848 RepID=A0A183BCX3_9TREM|nr:unnamed protein product [Echinostoma caproni]